MRYAAMLWGNVKAGIGGGNDGITPHIGLNGNWYIGDTDTGVKAKGDDGKSVELQTAGGYVQWRQTGGSWANLFKIPADGDPGQNAFLYVAYASDDQGSDFSLIPSNSLKYRAEIHVTEELDPPTESDFSGVTWVKYIGDDGEDGGGGGSASIVQHQGIIIKAVNWVEDGELWKYQIDNISLQDNDTVRIVPALISHDVTTFALIYPELEVENGIISIWAKNQPYSDIVAFIDRIGLSQINEPPPFSSSSGDNVYTSQIESEDYKFHVFTTVGQSSFEATAFGNVNVLIIGGGGAGGRRGAGGGGGEVKHLLNVQANPGGNIVIVGAGGIGATTYSAGNNGANSVFSNNIALGGGGGGTTSFNDGQDGGNGGGAFGAGSIGLGVYNGGTGTSNTGGGGGGANGHGQNAGTNGGNGGNCIDLSDIFGTALGETGTFAGGGGGSSSLTSKIPGIGGGGGSSDGSTSTPDNALPNTGGGGGGGYSRGADGGSGIVVVYYKI